MFKRFIICVTLIFFIFTQIFYIPASALLPTYAAPDLSNYPANLDGAMSFIGDCVSSVAFDCVTIPTNILLYPLDATVGSYCEDYFGVNPFDFPDANFYDCFSGYYLGNGHSGGGGEVGGYRDGSSNIDYNGSYSWNYPLPADGSGVTYLDDGSGGFFTLVDNSHAELPYIQVIDFICYHGGKVVASLSHRANYIWLHDYVDSSSSPEVHYHLDIKNDGYQGYFYCFYTLCFEEIISVDYSNCNYTVRNIYNNNISTHSIDRYIVQIKQYSSPIVQNNSTTVYTYNPVTNTIGNNYYYGSDYDGQPCLYDTNNSDNIYYFNDDGTFGSNNLYVIPDFSTLNDIDYVKLSNNVTNYYMSCYLNLASKSNNSDLYPFLTSLLNQMMTINSNVTKGLSTLNNTNSILNQINSAIQYLGKNPTTSNDNADIIILLTELKKGLLGDSEPYKLDQIIDLLKSIADPDSSEDLNGDEDIDYQIDWYIKTIPDLVREKIDFSSYFTQLSNLLNLLFGGGFDDVDYSSYFDTSQYFIESSGSSSVALSSLNSSNTYAEPSTSDYPQVFGDELASDDIPISSSLYLSAAVSTSGSTGEASRTPAPVLNVNIMGHTYNLFEYLTPEVYDKIQPFKSLITIFLYVWYLFWIIKRLPGLISDRGFGDY